MNNEARFLIEKLGLEPHEEGGYFKRTYESRQLIKVPGYKGKRHIGTAIYYLIVGDVVDPFHRIKSDELWHFYCGSSLVLHSIDPRGRLSKIPMGHDISAGQSVQAVLEGGNWFAAAIDDPSSYSLIGCTVCPGFDSLDFEFGKRDNLLKKYPQHKTLIEKFTQSERT